jgi:hypothetical protein
VLAALAVNARVGLAVLNLVFAVDADVSREALALIVALGQADALAVFTWARVATVYHFVAAIPYVARVAVASPAAGP